MPTKLTPPIPIVLNAKKYFERQPALEEFVAEVHKGRFPDEKNVFENEA